MTQNITAKLKYLKIAPRKTRFVADLVRGLPVGAAEAELLSNPRRPAVAILKLLRSAVSNAKKATLAPEKLYVKEIKVDQGPRLKRFMPRAFGRANLIEKKMSHVTLVLGVAEKPFAEIFVIAEKPKKEKKEKKIKEPKAAKGKEEFKEKKAAAPKPKEQPGFFRRIFRRKAV